METELRRDWLSKGVTVLLMALVVCAADLPAQQLPTAQQLQNISRVYQLAPGNVEAVAAELRKQYANNSEVRVASEPRTGRLIIVAPSNVHQQLAPVLKNTTNLAGPAAANTNAASVTTGQVAIKNLTTQTVMDAVQRLYQGRLKFTSEGKVAKTLVRDANGDAVQLTFDYSTGIFTATGTAAATRAWSRLIAALDRPASRAGERTQVVPVSRDRSQIVQRAIQLIQFRDPTVAGDQPPSIRLAQQPVTPAPQPGVPAVPNEADSEGLVGPVRIEYLEGLDVIVLRGNKRDVERVMEIIKEIEDLSVVTEPESVVINLEHVDSQAMADLITPLYDEVLSARQGRVSITALVKPNAILLIGRGDSVVSVSELVKKLDQPVAPNTQFFVFQLENMSAIEAEQTINDFYEERGGLGASVRVVSDFRSNSVIVQASPRDGEEIRELIVKVDVAESAAVSTVRVFRLRNSLAEDLAPILEDALRGRLQQGQGGQGGGAFPGGGPQGGGAGGINGQQQPRSTSLSMTTVDSAGQRIVKRAGVLADVQVTADARSNALVVRGPEKSMDLIAALVEQLDELPTEAAEIKVFTIVNGDAVLLADVLDRLFGIDAAGQIPGTDVSVGLGENPLLPLRFSVDERTNSIVASGTGVDLRVVEAILLRLDEDDVRQRESVVFRLRNAPALDVANAINEFLRSERQIQDVAPATLSPFQQIEREVIVVPEIVSNSLIVSATPRYFDEVYRIVRELDARPPMVLIQVLIAEVLLDNFSEFGLEWGLQSPVLFDRSGTGTDPNTGTPTIIPGFNFNNQPLGNSTAASPSTEGAQGLQNFGLGRTNSDLGFGGLVVSVSSETVSVLLRALERERRVQVLSRPQVMTLDNQPAFIQIGQRVPRITSTQLTQFGTINNTVLEDVGILLGVTPRISPDGLVVMEINAEKSELSDEGIIIAVSDGVPVESPIIDTTTAETVVSARSGQTVILGGLITEDTAAENRGIPYISDLPWIGKLFSYEQKAKRRTEFLIIMTPYVIRNDQDIDCINQVETDRLTWCMCDVFRVHGEFETNCCVGDGSTPRHCYPDRQPWVDAGWEPNGVAETKEEYLQSDMSEKFQKYYKRRRLNGAGDFRNDQSKYLQQGESYIEYDGAVDGGGGAGGAGETRGPGGVGRDAGAGPQFSPPTLPPSPLKSSQLPALDPIRRAARQQELVPLRPAESPIPQPIHQATYQNLSGGPSPVPMRQQLPVRQVPVQQKPVQQIPAEGHVAGGGDWVYPSLPRPVKQTPANPVP